MTQSGEHFRELFTRHPANPILEAKDWPYPANTVFNPGAVLLPDGETLLLVRVEDRRGISHLSVARSRDGYTNWRIDPSPSLYPDPELHPEEIWGVEDPRITWIDEIGEYAVTYTAYSSNGPLVALATTRDFESYTRRGPIMPPEDKDASLFPRRFDGRWALIHRPVPVNPHAKANIWLSWSPDLKHWGDHMVLLEARDGAHWDAGKIGLSPPPIETEAGWLVIYHGVRRTPGGVIYRIGLALLDLQNPTNVLHRGDEWVFGPTASYEQNGDVPNVAFSCGAVLDPASGELRMYYGAADTSIAVATARIDDLIAWLTANPDQPHAARRAGERGPLRPGAR